MRLRSVLYSRYGTDGASSPRVGRGTPGFAGVRTGASGTGQVVSGSRRAHLQRYRSRRPPSRAALHPVQLAPGAGDSTDAGGVAGSPAARRIHPALPMERPGRRHYLLPALSSTSVLIRAPREERDPNARKGPVPSPALRHAHVRVRGSEIPAAIGTHTAREKATLARAASHIRPRSRATRPRSQASQCRRQRSFPAERGSASRCSSRSALSAFDATPETYSPSLLPPRALHASSTDWLSTMRPSRLCPHRP